MLRDRAESILYIYLTIKSRLILASLIEEILKSKDFII